MHYTVLPKQSVSALVTAAQMIQQAMDDGIIGNAFCGDNPDHVQDAVTAFDRLNAAATELASESKIASPFIRYRREILAQGDTAERLRNLTLNLWGGSQVNLSQLFWHADEHHTRIALECIASYSQYGENDTFFMTLAGEIAEARMEQQSEVAE